MKKGAKYWENNFYFYFIIISRKILLIIVIKVHINNSYMAAHKIVVNTNKTKPIVVALIFKWWEEKFLRIFPWLQYYYDDVMMYSL